MKLIKVNSFLKTLLRLENNPKNEIQILIELFFDNFINECTFLKIRINNNKDRILTSIKENLQSFLIIKCRKLPYS